MERKYFVAEGPEAEKVLKEALELRKQNREALKAFIAKHSVDNLYGGRKTVTDLMVYIDDGKPEARPGFLKPQTSYEEGRRVALYKPDNRSKIGRAIQAEMSELEHFNFSDFVINAFKVYRMVSGHYAASRTGLALHYSVAGYVKDKLVFSIPFGDEDPEDSKPVPSCFREIKHSEYIALTEE